MLLYVAMLHCVLAMNDLHATQTVCSRTKVATYLCFSYTVIVIHTPVQVNSVLAIAIRELPGRARSPGSAGFVSPKA